MRRISTRWLLAVGLGVALAGLGLLGPVLGASARQAAEMAVDGESIAFRHVGVEQGLPSGVVLSITQDALGFIWIGTDEGLVRYDGVEVVPFRRTADSTSVSGNVVQVLAPGQKGAVWVGTGTGLSRYDAATNRFLRIAGLPSEDVLALEPDTIGGAWVGTASGLAHVTADGTVDQADRFDATDPSGLPHDIVEALYLAPDGDLWVGTGDGLARRRDGRFQTFRADSLDLDRGLPVSSIALSERGVLLVGTMSIGTGLLAFDPASGRFTPVDLGSDVIGQNVTDVHEDGDGTVWVGTLGGGLRRLTPGIAQPRIYEDNPDDTGSLSGDDVSGLLEDRQGILWVATYSGLDRFDRARGTAARLRYDPDDPASISSNNILSVLKTSDGTLYVGTDVSLDRSTDGRSFTHTPVAVPGDRPEHEIRTLYQDRDETVWVGTVGAGLRRVQPDGGLEAINFEGAGQTGSIVTSLLDDRARRFWVGTSTRGLGLYDRDSGQSEFYRHDPARPSSLADDTVLALAEDASGHVWVGTELGLCRLDDVARGGQFTCLPVGGDSPTALADGYVQALHARADGMLWIGTKDGFYGLDTDDVAGGVKRYTSDTSELPGDAVYAIVEDEAGFLWLSTNGGLARFQPFTEEFYRRLGSEDAERTLNAAATRAPNGELFFGSTRGLLAFFPGKLAALNANPPDVVITDVEVGGISVDPNESDILDTAAPVAERIDLGPDDSFLTIRYAGLHFSAPEANTYRYRMLGLYDEWNDAGSTREAPFPSLPAGKYTFEVQAANADGVGFDARTARIEVVVHPPWWRTWWALLGFAGLTVFGLVRADRWQRARMLRQERERAERRESELRAETAEAETAKATAEAAVLKAENDRKAAELERTRDVEAANTRLEASLRDLRETQAQLVQSEKLASLGQLTAGIAHEIKNPLNFVNNFADLSVELTEELREEMAEGADRPTSEILEEVGPLLDDLRDNCRRILEHGQRADGIVKSMLLHSRGGSADRGQVILNQFVEEYVNLAFHGARANDSDFQVEVVRDFDPEAGEVSLVPQEFGRVLINLLTNAFHTVVDKARTSDGSYKATVTVRTRREADEVVIEVADNGTGIPDEVKAKIFEPFFTTKPTGQGTGLGLSLAHDIVISMHGGRMWVESVPGEGTSFFVTLPTVPVV